MGDRGENVRQMQEKLQEYGYCQGEIDGAYGNQSRQAVEQFQYMHGLTVDGIAGRRTLTVLYESNEIRLPQGGTAAQPTPESQLSVALTPTPQAQQTPIPVLTATPAPSPTPEPLPSDVPLPVNAMEGYAVTVNGTETSMKTFRQGDTVYLPVLGVLREAGINVISSSTVQMDEYAFAVGMNLVRFTHTENQQRQPVDLQVYSNDDPQLVPNRSLYREDDVLYMPMESLESMTGLVCTLNEEQKQIQLITNAE